MRVLNGKGPTKWAVWKCRGRWRWIHFRQWRWLAKRPAWIRTWKHKELSSVVWRLWSGVGRWVWRRSSRSWMDFLICLEALRFILRASWESLIMLKQVVGEHSCALPWIWLFILKRSLKEALGSDAYFLSALWTHSGTNSFNPSLYARLIRKTQGSQFSQGNIQMKVVFISCENSSDETDWEVAQYWDTRFCEALKPIWALPHNPNKFIKLSLAVATLKSRACPLTQMVWRLMNFSLKEFCTLGGNFPHRCFCYWRNNSGITAKENITNSPKSVCFLAGKDHTNGNPILIPEVFWCNINLWWIITFWYHYFVHIFLLPLHTLIHLIELVLDNISC